MKRNSLTTVMSYGILPIRCGRSRDSRDNAFVAWRQNRPGARYSFGSPPLTYAAPWMLERDWIYL